MKYFHDTTKYSKHLLERVLGDSGDCGYSVVICVVRCVDSTFVTTGERLLEVEVDGG